MEGLQFRKLHTIAKLINIPYTKTIATVTDNSNQQHYKPQNVYMHEDSEYMSACMVPLVYITPQCMLPLVQHQLKTTN